MQRTPGPQGAPRRRPPTLSDVGLWLTWFILTAAVLLALCLMLTIAWPTP